ncbi:helix-turn-helix domain-containing protein [Nonomuraea sp. NPDC050310]|uniref:PucR family transcriptional regulator n=1 Tax=Nonomuraea sp. NPDC050310 TaxID=3154935 RepID=UPI0033C35CE2
MSAPRPRLGRILGDLGSTLFDSVIGTPDPTREVGGVVIHDPQDDPSSWRDSVVLGVGVHGPDHVAELVRLAGKLAAAAVIVRSPALRPGHADEVREAADQAGLPVLSLVRGASWTQVAALLRTVLWVDEAWPKPGESPGGIPSGDLFALANAVAALMDAPVTIEDRDSRVLAFSHRQDEADSSRIATVLGRQVPSEIRRVLEAQGVFRTLYQSGAPLYLDGLSSMPRAAIAVRAGDEILGSVWAAVSGPLSPERENALRDAAKLVALHLLRFRADSDVQRRLRADLLATALEGGPTAADAAVRLGLDARTSCCVLALALTGDPLAADRVADEQRMADALAVHLSAMHHGTATALLDGVVYAVLPSPPGRVDAERRALRIAEGFVSRIGERVPAVIGVGRAATGPAELPLSKAGADRALRALRRGRLPRRVASFGEVYMESLLADLAERVSDEELPTLGPIVRLRAYDARHQTRLTETLAAWLDAFGDVNAASHAVNVHPNTFRYRLRRLTEVGGIDLDDPDARFNAMFQLRLGR